MTSKVRNDQFNPNLGYSRGRSPWVFGLWQLVKWLFFKTVVPWPSGWKVQLLRGFGAKIGNGVYVKPQVNVHMPWRLEVGDHTWIGEEAYILNFEKVVIGRNACISQRAFLCTGNHDFRDPAMAYRNRSIMIEDGAWVGAQAFVAPGVTVGTDCVIAAGSVLMKNAEPGVIYMGNPAVPCGTRWRD